MLDAQIEKTLAWVCGSDGNVYALIVDQHGCYAVTRGGVRVRSCKGCDGGRSMEILMAMASADIGQISDP